MNSERKHVGKVRRKIDDLLVDTGVAIHDQDGLDRQVSCGIAILKSHLDAEKLAAVKAAVLPGTALERAHSFMDPQIKVA